MKISTRTTRTNLYNYETHTWDRETWEYYDEETGEAIPEHVMDAILYPDQDH